jgi:tetratricopeptide (TPR) repeat protein
MLLRVGMVALALVAAGGAQQPHQHDYPASDKLGTVRFANSCSDAAKPTFARAMALLHSFEFGQAIDGFTASAATDSGCAIAYWGIALSRWGNPFAAGLKPVPALEAGRTAIEKATAIGAKSERERDFITAAGRLFKDFQTIDQRTRLLAYRDAMEHVAKRYADDPEASAFYALALAASADPADKTYASLLKAGEILERLAPAQPDHPGFAHYIIHAYDVPALAPRALDAARRYSKIAPAAPHALHMPSHTFTRLGYWQESIDTNIASATVAHREGSIGEELHAMDYQAYAYLQTAQDAAALRVVQSLTAIAAKLDPDRPGSAAPPVAGGFALAAIPARYALERRAWSEAARLEVRPSRFPHAEALTQFARALGAASISDLATARTAIEALQQLKDKLTQAGESYWAEQVDIQRLGASAWLALKEDRSDEAVAAMRSAADREDRTEKNAVTPGPIAPARELLGEMLLQLKQPSEALAAFETTLKKEPNRFLAMAGAAHASKLSGDAEAARKYSKQLLTVAAKADSPGRPQLAEARQNVKTQ